MLQRLEISRLTDRRVAMGMDITPSMIYSTMCLLSTSFLTIQSRHSPAEPLAYEQYGFEKDLLIVIYFFKQSRSMSTSLFGGI